MHLDISYGTASDRLEAASYLLAAADYVPIVPLVLVLRALLQQHRLDKVMSGGLSSWVVAIMVVGFFMHRESSSTNGPEHDLGVLVVDFLRFYAHEFDCQTQVVAPAMGGIVPRAAVTPPEQPPPVVVLQPPVVQHVPQDNDAPQDDSNGARGSLRVYVQDPVTSKLLGGGELQRGAGTARVWQGRSAAASPHARRGRFSKRARRAGTDPA